MGYLNHSADGETLSDRHESSEIPTHILEKLRQKLSSRRYSAVLTPPTLHASSSELFRDACAMSQAGLSDEEQEIVLRARFWTYYRRLEDREFSNAITNARAQVEGGADCEGFRRYPRPNEAARAAVMAEAPATALAVLREKTPIKNPQDLTTGEVLDLIFGDGDPLLCFSTASKYASTEPRSFFRGTEHCYHFLVPSPMNARYGHTKGEGRQTVRSLENVGPRMHVVVEFDTGSLDEQAALILHLAQYCLPLRMVIFSGGKSLHAWFDVRGFCDESVQLFLRYAAWVGADTATFSPVQLVRMPNVEREPGRMQEVLYLDAPMSRSSGAQHGEAAQASAAPSAKPPL